MGLGRPFVSTIEIKQSRKFWAAKGIAWVRLHNRWHVYKPKKKKNNHWCCGLHFSCPMCRIVQDICEECEDKRATAGCGSCHMSFCDAAPFIQHCFTPQVPLQKEEKNTSVPSLRIHSYLKCSGLIITTSILLLKKILSPFHTPAFYCLACIADDCWPKAHKAPRKNHNRL